MFLDGITTWLFNSPFSLAISRSRKGLSKCLRWPWGSFTQPFGQAETATPAGRKEYTKLSVSLTVVYQMPSDCLVVQSANYNHGLVFFLNTAMPWDMSKTRHKLFQGMRQTAFTTSKRLADGDRLHNNSLRQITAAYWGVVTIFIDVCMILPPGGQGTHTQMSSIICIGWECNSYHDYDFVQSNIKHYSWGGKNIYHIGGAYLHII